MLPLIWMIVNLYEVSLYTKNDSEAWKEMICQPRGKDILYFPLGGERGEQGTRDITYSAISIDLSTPTYKKTNGYRFFYFGSSKEGGIRFTIIIKINHTTLVFLGKFKFLRNMSKSQKFAIVIRPLKHKPPFSPKIGKPYIIRPRHTLIIDVVSMEQPAKACSWHNRNLFKDILKFQICN
ncbi:hypothetical protein AGLY_008668 [Aphis glycines]|uniref:Uncharacterized protein n=1 Tax=Aphis glycines TaxID=307491 RepID=A0A6G0TJU9_APHGL|nr:hypothetical protein AGLY_008668 [Aphis glycines]